MLCVSQADCTRSRALVQTPVVHVCGCKQSAFPFPGPCAIAGLCKTHLQVLQGHVLGRKSAKRGCVSLHEWEAVRIISLQAMLACKQYVFHKSGRGYACKWLIMHVPFRVSAFAVPAGPATPFSLLFRFWVPLYTSQPKKGCPYYNMVTGPPSVCVCVCVWEHMEMLPNTQTEHRTRGLGFRV